MCQGDLPVFSRGIGHRTERVGDEIDEHLLHRHMIGLDYRKVRLNLRADRRTVLADFTLKQLDNLQRKPVRVNQLIAR